MLSGIVGQGPVVGTDTLGRVSLIISEVKLGGKVGEALDAAELRRVACDGGVVKCLMSSPSNCVKVRFQMLFPTALNDFYTGTLYDIFPFDTSSCPSH